MPGCWRGVTAPVRAPLLGALVLFFSNLSAAAADVSAPTPSYQSFLALAEFDPLARPNGIVVFGGPMSTRALGSTLIFDLGYPVPMNYDNYFVGVAYDRNLWRLGYGFTAGFEVGIGDRFGHYYFCCDLVIKSSSMLNSPELWAGPRLSFDGVVIGNTLRIAGALTLGFSVAASSLGREREAEFVFDGNARFLGYLGPELSFSLIDHPDWDLVYRIQHRSGADGLLGRIREGYNANTIGLRHKF
jgi:hypothetical protein